MSVIFFDLADLIFTRETWIVATAVELAGAVVFPRRAIPGEDGSPFRIRPLRPVSDLRPGALAASPQKEEGRFRAPDLLARLAPTHSPAWRELAVSVLHEVVLNHLVPQKLGAQAQCRYVHLIREVTESVAAKGCQLAALVPPASMKHVEQIAGTLERMPPKSTYFYPKLLSGLVFNPLWGD